MNATGAIFALEEAYPVAPRGGWAAKKAAQAAANALKDESDA